MTRAAMTDAADPALLARFQRSKDQEVFAELVRRHAALGYASCRRVLGDAHLAEDAAQETFVELVRAPASVRGSLPAWLHRVAVSKALDVGRRESSQRRRQRVAAATPPRE